MMETLHKLTFKNNHSLEYGLYITGKNIYKGAARDVTYQEIPGRNGDLIMDNGRYKNIPAEYQLALLETESNNFVTLTHQVKAWLLSSSGYFQLYDTYDPDYFRLASYSDETNIEQELKVLGKTTFKFNCKPFMYSFAGQTAVTLTEAEIVNNPEAFSSLPYIKITGSGNITLSINSDSFYFVGVDGYIEVDSEAMIAYKGAASQNSIMQTVPFPKLTPGNNAISWVGSVSAVEIVPRWCCL